MSQVTALDMRTREQRFEDKFLAEVVEEAKKEGAEIVSRQVRAIARVVARRLLDLEDEDCKMDARLDDLEYPPR